MMIFLKKFFEKWASDQYFYPVLLLVLSACIMFFQLNGSLGSYDESIYSEVAKEGILKNNWLETFYEGKIWIDKPPFLIWITMLAYKIFGVNEIAARFFPAFFGVMGVLSIYILAKQLFNSKIAFFSALVILSVPHYLLMSRTNMTDIFLFVFVNFSFIFFFRSFRNQKEIILCGLFLGLAFMTKSAVALLFILLFFAYIFLKKDSGALRSKYFIYSIIIFFIITVPWHLFMFLKYGKIFLDSYIGYHLVRRFNENIIATPFVYDKLFYLKIIMQRAAAWWLVFLTLIPVLYLRVKNSKDTVNLKFLIAWALFIIIFFSLAATKLQQYIFPFYVPFAILLGYGLYFAVQSKSYWLLLSFSAVFINMSPAMIKNVSDIGEARLVFPKILFLAPLPQSALYTLLFIVFLFLAFCFVRRNIFGCYAAIFLIFAFSFLLPFNPDRRPEAPKINGLLLSLGVKTLYMHNADYLKAPLVFYGYPKYNIIELSGEGATGMKKADKINSINNYCIFKLNGAVNPNFFLCQPNN